MEKYFTLFKKLEFLFSRLGLDSNLIMWLFLTSVLNWLKLSDDGWVNEPKPNQWPSVGIVADERLIKKEKENSSLVPCLLLPLRVFT